VTVLRARRGPAIGAALAAGGGALAALLLIAGCRVGHAPLSREGTPAGARLEVAAGLRAPDARGFARAQTPRPFVFPADHGPHPEFRTEWWYYTGNLGARDGRRFGFQLTFFRVALAPPAAVAGGTATAETAAAPRRTSAWATRQVYFAHFTLTDAAGRRFLAHERWEREALDLAGARPSPFRVWVGPWSAAAAGAETGGTPPMRLVAVAPAGAEPDADGKDGSGFSFATRRGDAAAAGAEAAIDLLLRPALPPVPQGDRGLSVKSAEPGNASYYYSLPRLAAAGTLRLGGERVPVTGLAWMDREWSTSTLAAGEVGWDWLGLQLDDGWELMVYRLRRAGAQAAGTPAGGGELADPASRATLIAPDGSTEVLPLAALRWEVTGHWTSPARHTRYPSGWRLTLPSGPPGPAVFDLTLQPLLEDQELRLSFNYWEGAAIVRGSHLGQPVAGRGYVELTGYGDAGPPARLH
jgi:predicted secreted hydrolase